MASNGCLMPAGAWLSADARVGVSAARRRVRFDGVGDYSGDWGGGGQLGREAVAGAVRGVDGRGPRTSLERLVPAHFGLRTPAALTRALYLGRIEDHRLSELAPLVFRAAGQGDGVARSILDRLADELSGMAAALIRRLGMRRLDPEVVLAGRVFRARDDVFTGRLELGILGAAPRARIERLDAPPVLGAALLGLDAGADAGVTDAAVAGRLRDALISWDAAGRQGTDVTS